MNTYPVHPEAVKLFYDVEANFRVQLEFRGEDSKGNWKERVITFIHRRNKGIDKIVGQQLQPESLCYDVMFDQIQELLQKGWSPCVGSLKKLPTEEMERLDPFSSIFSLAPKYSEELEVPKFDAFGYKGNHLMELTREEAMGVWEESLRVKVNSPQETADIMEDLFSR